MAGRLANLNDAFLVVGIFPLKETLEDKGEKEGPGAFCSQKVEMLQHIDNSSLATGQKHLNPTKLCSKLSTFFDQSNAPPQKSRKSE